MNFNSSFSVLGLINQSSFSSNTDQSFANYDSNSKNIEISKSVADGKNSNNQSQSEFKKIESDSNPDVELKKNIDQVKFGDLESNANIQDPPKAKVKSDKSVNLDPVDPNVSSSPGKIRKEKESSAERSKLNSQVTSSFSEINQTQYQKQESKDTGPSPDSKKVGNIPTPDQTPRTNTSIKPINIGNFKPNTPKFNMPKFNMPKF